jgi:cell division protein DivIC
MMMKWFDLIPGFLKNKYFLASLAFGIWMIFFDRDDVFTQVGRYQKLKDLQQSNEFYAQKISATKEELEKRKNDPAAFERVAREKYYMKRTNEDVFLFEE